MDTGRHETEIERLDRNLSELLVERRVALPGVQVLFAFLLVVPFSRDFHRVSEFERTVYFATLVCTALASMLLIAPSIHHRILFRQGEKHYLVNTANRLTIAGLTVLAVAMSGAILLITHVLFGTATAVITAMAVAAAFGGLWYGLPLGHRIRR